MAQALWNQPQASLTNSGSATGTALPVNNGHQVSYEIAWQAGVTAGVVIIESNSDKNDTGTWAEIDTLTFSGTAPKKEALTQPCAFTFVRARATGVTGGTVTVKFQLFGLE